MIRSKLPHVGTTIFTVMTNRARELGAINLAQGFPDYDAPAKLKELVAYHVAAGHNQYAPMIGVAAAARADRAQARRELRPAARQRDRNHDHARRDRGASSPRCTALVHPGDEVILFDPVVRFVCAGRAARGRAADARAAAAAAISGSIGTACAQRCRRARGW